MPSWSEAQNLTKLVFFMQVIPITNGATPTVGTAISLGKYTDSDTSQRPLGFIQAISADRTSNIWLAGSTFLANDTLVNNVYQIAYGSSVVSPVSVTLATGANALSGKLPWTLPRKCPILSLKRNYSMCTFLLTVNGKLQALVT